MSSSTSKTHIVLVADDEKSIAETLCSLIEDMGYVAIQAPHGKAALELALKQWPTLLITDFMMPYMDGAALVAAIQMVAKDEHYAPVGVILMTATNAHYIPEGIHADAIVQKPFDIDEMEKLILTFLNRK